MGITGLLPLLKSIQKPCNLKKFSGQTIGVDGYGWLHRGAVGCAVELVLGKPTTRYLDFFMHRVRMLIHFGITPYLIFDGDALPSKAGTNADRREKRQTGKKLGLELLRVGKTTQAYQELQKTVEVTPEMVKKVIEELKHHNVPFIVAPFEADSQLAYLERKGIINGVLSEDSDLLVFGVKCLITKLDKYGECVEINRNHFTACREVSLVGWSDADFRRMAILSGCDYLPNIGGLGLKTAYRMLMKHKTVERLVKAAQFDGKLKVPAGYLEAFEQAERTFLYQWAFCPVAKQLVHLTVLEAGIDSTDMPYLGEEVPAHIAIKVARGDVHPKTKLPLIVATKMKAESKPLMSSRRALTTIQTPDLKGIKSIDSFFRPKRTPLAELDPNCFTPSPNQQVIMEQLRNSDGWIARPAPGSALHQVQIPSTAPIPARRTTFEPLHGRRSASNPSKRQRLCSPSIFDTPGINGEVIVRSQFFVSPAPEPSPSLRSTKTSGKRAQQTFDLYSDDSIHDAMGEAADLEESISQRRKKMRVFSDVEVSRASDSQSTMSSRGSTELSQDSVGDSTPATLVDSQDAETMLSAGVSQRMSDLPAKFSYDIAKLQSCSTDDTVVTKDSTASLQAQGVEPPFVTKTSSNVDLNHVPAETCIPDSPLTNEELEFTASAWAVADGEVVVAASSPPWPSTPRTKKYSLKGSEDLLVPDSDAESESSPRKPMFNLSRFAFAG